MASDSDGSISSWLWQQTSGSHSVTIKNSTTSNASFAAPEVDAETTLVFELEVKDNDGASVSDSMRVTVRGPGDSVNPLPSDFKAEAGDGQVTLTWSHYSSATYYNIYRSSASDCELANYTSCANGALFTSKSSPFTDTGLSNGTTYHYWIEAILEGVTYLSNGAKSATPSVDEDDDIDLIDGLVAHYEFDGDASDSSGNGNDGIEYGDVGYVDGLIGRSASFDGAGDYVDVNSFPFNENRVFSASVWINMNSIDNVQYIIDMRKEDTSNNASTVMFDSEDQAINFAIFGEGHWINSGKILVPNKWYNVVVIQNSAENNLKIYINGDIYYDGHVYSLDTDETPVRIGSRRFTDDRNYNGLIDDIRIYDRALSTEEVQALYELVEDYNDLIFQEDYSSYSAGSLPEDYVIVYNGQGDSQQYVDSDGDEKWLRTAGAYSWDLAMRKDFDEHLTGTVTVEWDMQAAGTSDPSADHGYLAKLSLKGITLHAGITIDHHEDDGNDYASCSSADLDANDRIHLEVVRQQWNTYRMDMDFDSGRFNGYVNDELLCSQYLMTEADLSSTWNRLSEDSSIVFESKNPTSTITLFDNIKIWQ